MQYIRCNDCLSYSLPPLSQCSLLHLHVCSSIILSLLCISAKISGTIELNDEGSLQGNAVVEGQSPSGGSGGCGRDNGDGGLLRPQQQRVSSANGHDDMLAVLEASDTKLGQSLLKEVCRARRGCVVRLVFVLVDGCRYSPTFQKSIVKL